MIGRNKGSNAEGDYTPAQDAWGRALVSGVPSLIANPLPIGAGAKGDTLYGGNVGGVVIVNGHAVPLVGQEEYSGDVPRTLQPQVKVPDPWNRV